MIMAQSRPSYAYNPDLPTRKWHQKWITPIISLQNAPPTSHGTPAPTKEDGEFGHAGFKVHAWIPMDEDDDVTGRLYNRKLIGGINRGLLSDLGQCRMLVLLSLRK